MRIGILGGTFDPIHKGHLELAKAALSKLHLDQVIFVPAFKHPLREKDSYVSASSEDRYEMVKRAIKDVLQFSISDIELKRKGISYTVDTLKLFRKQYPIPHELFFITGGDWGKNLDQWKEINAIFSLAHFVVASRPGFDLKNLPQSVKVLDFVPLNVSSTQLRQEIKQGKFPERLIPSDVLTYIKRKQLYQT